MTAFSLTPKPIRYEAMHLAHDNAEEFYAWADVHGLPVALVVRAGTKRVSHTTNNGDIGAPLDIGWYLATIRPGEWPVVEYVGLRSGLTSRFDGLPEDAA